MLQSFQAGEIASTKACHASSPQYSDSKSAMFDSLPRFPGLTCSRSGTRLGAPVRPNVCVEPPPTAGRCARARQTEQSEPCPRGVARCWGSARTRG